MYKDGLFQKYFGHFLKIKSKNKKKILFFLVLLEKKTKKDLKNDNKKLIIKKISSKNEFLINFLSFIYTIFNILT